MMPTDPTPFPPAGDGPLPAALTAAAFLALADVHGDAVAIRLPDPDGRLHANPRFCQWLDLSSDAVATLTAGDLEAHLAALVGAAAGGPALTVSHQDLIVAGQAGGRLTILRQLPVDGVAAMARLRHDARTPLTAIQIYVECLLEDVDLTEDQEHDLRQTLGEVRRLTGILSAKDVPSAD